MAEELHTYKIEKDGKTVTVNAPSAPEAAKSIGADIMSPGVSVTRKDVGCIEPSKTPDIKWSAPSTRTGDKRITSTRDVSGEVGGLPQWPQQWPTEPAPDSVTDTGEPVTSRRDREPVMSRLEASREWVRQYGEIPPSGTKGIDVYREGVESIMYGDKPAKGYGAKVGVYQVNTGDGQVLKIRATTEDQAQAIIENWPGKIFEVTGVKKIGEDKLTVPQAYDAIRTAQMRSKVQGAFALQTYGEALPVEHRPPEGGIPIRTGKDLQDIVFMTPEEAEGIRNLPFYDGKKGTDIHRLTAAYREIQELPKVELPDDQWIPRKSVRDKDGKIVIVGWDDIPARYRVIGMGVGLVAMREQMFADQEAATARLEAEGFRETVPEVYMQAAGSPPLKAYTIPAMAEFIRNNPDGRQVLENYGFTNEVLNLCEKFNKEASSIVDYINKHVGRLPEGEFLALKRAIDMTGELDIKTISKMSVGEILEQFPIETTGLDVEAKVLARAWFRLDNDTKVAVAVLFDKDYTKGSRLSSFARDLQHVSSKNLAAQIILAVPTSVLTPIGKKLTLDEAKAQLGEDYQNERKILKGYVDKEGVFDVEKLSSDLDKDPDLEAELLEKTGYKDRKQLIGSLEYYNYGTTVTAKEWAIGGLTLGLVAVPLFGRALSTLGVFGSLVRHGIPASLAAVMLPDTIRILKDKDASVGNKVFVASVTAALLAGAVIGVGKFAYRELRHLVKPGTFDASGLSLEVHIPRDQLKANMTPSMAQTLVQDLERVWGATLPDEMVTTIGKFKTPADFQVWASALVRHGVMTTHIRRVAGDIAAGGIRGRANPFQAAVGNNVLFSVKPDMATYGRAIGRSVKGIDRTPAGSMEWWSPNFSGDVAGWYLGKVKQYIPGAKMLRFSPHDIRSIPQDIFIKVAEQMRNPKVWASVKVQARGDTVTAINLLIRREFLRRAVRPNALPDGIYPVFKFHWSRQPTGKLRPTWELEMVTPAGFSVRTFKPVRYLDRFQTGGTATPEVASLTVRSPIEGIDLKTGQRIRLGQPMPVIITATKRAIAEGKGLPTLKELYKAKFYYRPIAAVQNIFTRGKLMRPRADEASLVTTPMVRYNRTIKFQKVKVNPSDALARRTLLRMSPDERVSTARVASKIEGAKADPQGRFSTVREGYYHPVYEYADNWVVPRTGVMIRHPTIKGAYIVATDTSTAAQPGVWDIVGGQIDPLGRVRLSRPFGRISLLEAAHEQVISELGIRLKVIRPAAIHLGKTTEHSAFGTYMFDATAASTKFRIPMNKWYDMVRGQWVIEPEVSAVGVLKPGQRAAVTPALYIELARRGFDVRNLVIVDRGLPTAGIGQYAFGTYEYNALTGARIYRPWQVGGIGKGVSKMPLNEALIRAKGETVRVTNFTDAVLASSPDEFIVPYAYKQPIYTGLVPTLRVPTGYSPAIVLERAGTVAEIPHRVGVPYTGVQTLVEQPYEISIPRSDVQSYSPTMATYKRTPTLTKTYTPTITTGTTPVYTPVIPTFVPYPHPARKEQPGRVLPLRTSKTGRVRPPPGALTWKQGIVWWLILPPWTQEKPIPLSKPPIGAKNIGGRTPEDTIQMLGKPGAKVPETASIDLGIADILIYNFGKDISFTGKGLETVAGKNIPLASVGMSVPATVPVKIGVAKGRGKDEEKYNKLAFGTSTTLLMKEAYREGIPKKFADHALSDKLGKMSPVQIAEEIKKANVPQKRRAEILAMLPDRVRNEVELFEGLETAFAPTRGVPKAELTPVPFRRKKRKKEKKIEQGEQDVGLSAARA